MLKSQVIFLFTISLIFSLPTIHAEKYLNFDAEIQDAEWKYNAENGRIIFSVDIYNKDTKANYITHLDIYPEKNMQFHTQSNIIQIESGHSKSTDLEYRIPSIDTLAVDGWINPPTESGNPNHKFDEFTMSIFDYEVWREIKDAKKGTELNYKLVKGDHSDIQIEVDDLSIESSEKWIRVIYSGNLDMCDSISFKSESHKFSKWAGHSFFDRTFDFGEYETIPDFSIVCSTSTNDEIIITSELEKKFEDNIALSQVHNCHGVICIYPNNISTTDIFPWNEMLGIVAALIGLVAVMIKFNWIPIKRRKKV